MSAKCCIKLYASKNRTGSLETLCRKSDWNNLSEDQGKRLPLDSMSGRALGSSNMKAMAKLNKKCELKPSK